MEAVKEGDGANNNLLELKPVENESRARVDAVWEQMNKGISKKALHSLTNSPIKQTKRKASSSSSSNWMSYLGMASSSIKSPAPQKRPAASLQSETSDEAKRLAAAALSAVRGAAAAAASASARGKVEITEVRDFAGQDIEVKKLVDADSKEATDKGKAAAAAPSAVDAILEQIKKKQKLSVLDKTKKDWGEFKEENKGLEDELDAYKKSSNKYLDKVSFLERADYREFERERDARLAVQSRRKSDTHNDL